MHPPPAHLARRILFNLQNIRVRRSLVHIQFEEVLLAVLTLLRPALLVHSSGVRDQAEMAGIPLAALLAEVRWLLLVLRVDVFLQTPPSGQELAAILALTEGIGAFLKGDMAPVLVFPQPVFRPKRLAAGLADELMSSGVVRSLMEGQLIPGHEFLVADIAGELVRVQVVHHVFVRLWSSEFLPAAEDVRLGVIVRAPHVSQELLE